MGIRIRLIGVVLAALFCLAACSRDKDQAKQAVAPVKPAETAKRQPLPPQPPPEILPVSGKVLEVIDTGSFIYVLVDWQGQKVWATVPGVDLKVGEVIGLDHATMFEKFHSNALNRTFDKLIFASGVVGKPPRSRVVNKANPKDPKSRRSGKIAAGLAPAPPKPTGKVTAKAGE